MDKAARIADDKNKIDHIHWYVLHYIPSIPQQSISSKQFLNKTPTELRYIERSVFLKEVFNQNLWDFELDIQKRMHIPIWITIVFQQRDR